MRSYNCYPTFLYISHLAVLFVSGELCEWEFSFQYDGNNACKWCICKDTDGNGRELDQPSITCIDELQFHSNSEAYYNHMHAQCLSPLNITCPIPYYIWPDPITLTPSPTAINATSSPPTSTQQAICECITCSPAMVYTTISPTTSAPTKPTETPSFIPSEAPIPFTDDFDSPLPTIYPTEVTNMPSMTPTMENVAIINENATDNDIYTMVYILIVVVILLLIITIFLAVVVYKLSRHFNEWSVFKQNVLQTHTLISSDTMGNIQLVTNGNHQNANDKLKNNVKKRNTKQHVGIDNKEKEHSDSEQMYDAPLNTNDPLTTKKDQPTPSSTPHETGDV